MKQGDLIHSYTLKKGHHRLTLDQIYPIGDIRAKHLLDRTFYIDDIPQQGIYANIIEINLAQDDDVEIYLGQGYVAIKDEALTERFLNHDGWSGGDGIFTFNMENGNDSFDQDQIARTLFVFGDTFIGRSDPNTKKRLQPHLMANNSIAYLDQDQLSFHLNWDKDGSIRNFYTIDPQFDLSGTIPYNMINYDRKAENLGYLSGYHPQILEMEFDFHQRSTITHADVWNYHSKEASFLSKRGIKQMTLMGSNDKKSWDTIQEFTLDMNATGDDYQTLNINRTYRYIKMVVPTTPGIGNHNDEDFTEGLYGINLVKFYHERQLYRDIHPSATSVLQKTQEHAWIWLQDGVVIGNHLYFIPIIINGDDTQPEGLQFKVVGAALFKTRITDGSLDFNEITQKIAPILLEKGDSNYLFGSALMANTIQAGAKNPDGYIYIYGYKTTMGLRELLVARVKAETFEYFDTWRYYDGKGWSDNLFDAQPLLPHVSCEMSVSPLNEGLYAGQYIAVYTFDTNTPYVAYSIAKTPWGPFTDPQIIYHTPEQDIFKSTTYTYNAKAHPHLSKSTDILVTYNTNTYSFDHNMSDYRVYRARFIHLKDTTS